jgi:hypothetical protein
MAAGACAVVAITDPAHGGLLPVCPFKALTGWACPVCGSTRMLHALLHGDVASAARYNVVVLAALPVLMYGWIRWAAPLAGARRPATWRPSTRVQLLGVALVLVFAVLRNLPWAPVQGLRV